MRKSECGYLRALTSDRAEFRQRVARVPRIHAVEFLSLKQASAVLHWAT